MRPPAINFRNQPLGAPEEVHDISVNPNVHFRPGKAVAATEGEELRLELAAAVVGRDGLPDGKAEVLRLA